MTVTTTTHAGWSSHPEDLPVASAFTVDARPGRTGTAADDPEMTERMRSLIGATTPTAGDPAARTRMAAAMHRLTGWDVFAEDEDIQRAYISRLWAEDWDSLEDSEYDER